MTTISWLSIYSALSVFVHILGIAHAGHAVMKVKSSRSAIAWSISLISLPWIVIPLYWLLGKNKFYGYSEALNTAYTEHQELVQEARSELFKHKAHLPPQFATLENLTDRFTALPFTTHNTLDLLVDGEQTYQSMLAAIAAAKNYILFQSYIIKGDDIGNQFKDALIAKAQQGVRVYLLYDGLGSMKLPRDYIEDLRQAGVVVSSFRSSKGKNSRFQLNFRNHRKILVIDGRTGFVGGLNIGDEYLGKDPHLGEWRDTHTKIQGPAVTCLQTILLGDWYWATRDVLDVNWDIDDRLEAQPADSGQTTFILASGPADSLQVCSLFFLNLINQAQERLWIASPYFVPDGTTLNALKLAAIRGVDVRIILPTLPDQKLVYFCSFSYYNALRQVGIQVYRHRPGFMHQKVILCDHAIAGVGTVNLDNRSFFLNFEVMAFAINHGQSSGPDSTDFIQNVEKMLENDLATSRLVDLSSYQKKPIWFKLAARASRLLSPIL